MSYDVFISYAHNDNMVTPPETYGWVDNFHIALYNFLTEKLGLGRKAEIWRDRTGLNGNALLDRALAGGVNSSLLFIPILSPNYLASKYCIQELETFCSQPDVFRGEESRIFPVVKLPIEAPPARLEENLLRFKFYNVDVFGEPSEELNPSFGSEFRNKFNLKVNDLAREIAEFIKEIEKKKEPDPVIIIKPPEENLPLVYLAEPSPDLLEQYNEIRRDLEQRKNLEKLKFDFLTPEPKKLTDDENTYKQKVIQDLRKCRLVVNLIGKEPNSFPKGITKSHIQIQAEAAAEVEKTFEFTRLVWIPRNTASEDADLQAFIDNIRQTGVGMDGLMQDSFEDFKSRIIKVLTVEEENTDGEAEKPWVYVLYDKSDLDSAISMEDELYNKRFPYFSSRDYLDPALRGTEEIDVLEAHNDYLTRCDAVLIYWDKSPLTWVRKSIFDLPRIKPVRKQSFRAQAVFCAGDIKAKAVFRSPPPPNLLKVEGFPNLSKFLDKLSKVQNDERER